MNEAPKLTPEQMFLRFIDLVMGRGEFETAIKELQQYLSTTTDLPERWRKVFEGMNAALSKSLDPNYRPPSLPSSEDCEPLNLLSWRAAVRGDFKDALRKKWEYMQYLRIGTFLFHNAISDIATLALRAGYEQLAKEAARLYLAHLRFWEALSGTSLKPCQKVVYFPHPDEVALRFIHEEDDPVWSTILEQSLGLLKWFREEFARSEGVEEPPLPPHGLRLLEVLVSHYLKFGYSERLQTLLQKYPDAERFIPRDE